MTATVGVGIKLTPSALLIMQGDDVQVYSLSQKGNLAKLVEMIPDVISKLKLQEKDEQTSE
ncbi:MAG: GerW family sporulation protein [Bacillota bacterium]